MTLRLNPPMHRIMSRTLGVLLLAITGTASTATHAHGGNPCADAHQDAPEACLSLFADARAVVRDAPALAFAVPGFLAGGDIGPTADGLSLPAAGAVIDWRHRDSGLYGALEAGLHTHGGHADNTLLLEQAWVAHDGTRLATRIGRQFAPLGFGNSVHGPAAPFPEAGLAARVFLGDHYVDDGMALRTTADDSLVLGAGLWRGAFPAGGIGTSGNDAATAHLDWHPATRGDWTLDFRLSALAARAALRYDERFDPGHSHDPFTPAPVPTYFTGDTQLGIASVQWRRPRQGLSVLAELFWREEEGTIRSLTQSAAYRGKQAGLQGELLWSPRTSWRIGLRHALLAADNILSGPGAATLAAQANLATNGRPAETALLLEQRLDARQALRLQWIDARQVHGGDSILLQYAFTWHTPLR